MDANDNDNEPNLRQYFANDPPSFFDELTTNVGSININSDGIGNNLNTNSLDTDPTSADGFYSYGNIADSVFKGSFAPIDYVECALATDDDDKITNDIRNFWEAPIMEPGVPPLITMPSIKTPNELPDLIASEVVKHLGEQELIHRQILDVSDVTQDDKGLRTLIVSGCYRAAVNLIGRLLSIHGQGYGRSKPLAKHSPHSLQLWFTRLALLQKLGEYKLLQQEAEPFEQLNRPDMFYEFYNDAYPGESGSMASFSFRLLLAELPICFSNPHIALDNLSKLCIICREIKQYYSVLQLPNAVKFWHKRSLAALYATVNCALVLKKFSLVDDILEGITFNRSDLEKEEKRALFSAWGRIYLQIGDIFGAEQKFTEARRLKKIYSQPDLRDLIDKGLIMVAKNQYAEAYTIFQKALQLENGNIMILNNMGVCLLYAGKLKDAINLFERAISLNPQKSLNESLLINLSTLYELESNNSKIRKLNLLKLINRYKPNLNISAEICLKLQSN